ncbi:hypothetical protein K504DRAFT_454594 [Pleomassaria siparia CBS 279.74]|uniref:Zn(2)-C6 fungal-type domain-containing protein n=1 Tax=Pleomassaria siparia CBS 279.74 TaxID=1314801 RepID=A0A6G1KCV7_9PLEO|nr:hypothetical protein K504DRAFT_454594 [Pleomassaria siparia CBS 279.74]
MPVIRRSCDYCRNHKLKCETSEGLETCRRCIKRKQPCTMQSPSSDTNLAARRSGPNPMGSLQSRPTTQNPDILLPPSSASEHQTLQLRKSIDELRRLLDERVNSSQSTQASHELGQPSYATKRTHDQIISSDDISEHRNSRFRVEETNVLPSHTDMQMLAPGRLPVPPSQMDTPGSIPSPHAQNDTVPSMPLENCVSGRCYLPPPEEGSALLNEYLHDFNSRIPLFKPELIYSHVKDCYSGVAGVTPLAWVLAYIALGIGHRLRAMSLFATDDDTSNADWYLNKCLAVLPNLLLQQPTLSLVQAVLGISILLQTSARSRKASLFVSTAMRLAQDLGYNEADIDIYGGEGSTRDEQELRVFWIAFFMDTSMNLSANRLGTQKLVDISVPFPNHGLSDSWTMTIAHDESALSHTIEIFSLHTTLAIIQAEALEELFSVKARQRSSSVLDTNAYKSFLSKLSLWRASSPIAGSESSNMLNSMFRSDVAHVIILEASYFGTLYQLHAANALARFTRRLDVFCPDSLRAAAGLVASGVYPDARRLLDFAAMIPQQNSSITWVTMNARIAALCVALAYYHVNETINRSVDLASPRLAPNLQLYKETLEHLEAAAMHAKDTILASKMDVCREFYNQVKELNQLPITQ